MSRVLEIRDLSLERAGRMLFSDLTLDLEAGEICVVLGPNGAGKSSLLLAAAGMLACDGEVSICGRGIETYSRRELAGRLAWAGALPATDFGLTVRQRLELAAQGADVSQAVATMEVEKLLDRPLGRLSSGELQRTELAALALRDVPLWLVDEPSAHLDLKHQVQALAMLRRAARAGRGMLVVLHDIQQARMLADRVVLLDGRGGIECGPADLLQRERLGRIFGTGLVAQDDVWLPDYRAAEGGGDEAKG